MNDMIYNYVVLQWMGTTGVEDMTVVHLAKLRSIYRCKIIKYYGEFEELHNILFMDNRFIVHKKLDGTMVVAPRAKVLENFPDIMEARNTAMRRRIFGEVMSRKQKAEADAEAELMRDHIASMKKW